MYLSLPNATNNDLLLSSSLIVANSDPCGKKLPVAIFRCNLFTSQPTIIVRANYLDRSQQQIEHNSSHLSLHTAAALLCNSRVHRCPVFLLLQLHPCYNRCHLDKLFLKCHIQLNQLWVLMWCSLISGYFHDFTEERTMMLKVFPNDDLGSTAHDHKKEQEKDIHVTPTVLMPSILMVALLERGNVFVLGADTSRVGIDVTLMQDGLIHTMLSPYFTQDF
ncbi:hypothetical protein GW17_00020569 [Ensete ventricosum]|nr:hypothetical protein GW17_00020569 [Ensete ventricosum]